MGIFDLKGSSGAWNYSNPEKQGYMEELKGTVVEISNPQHMNFATKMPEFWPDGHPKEDIRITVKGQSGREAYWQFQKRTKGGLTAAGNAVLRALDPDGTAAGVSFGDLLGKQVRIWTKPGSYSQSNPRPWWMEILGDGDVAAVRGIVDLTAANTLPPQQPQQPQQQGYPSAMQAAQAQAAAAQGFPAAPAPQYEEGGSVYDEDIPF